MEDKKLDLNSIIGFVLIFGILIWMMYQNQPTEKEIAAEKAKNEQVDKEGKVNKLVKNQSVFEELSKIDATINKKLIDSTSNTLDDYNYRYWFKDGKIIKLSVFGTDNEDLSSCEDYYFKDNSNVFGLGRELFFNMRALVSSSEEGASFL